VSEMPRTRSRAREMCGGLPSPRRTFERAHVDKLHAPPWSLQLSRPHARAQRLLRDWMPTFSWYRDDRHLERLTLDPR
jgi:hypothetical protein